ncbi:MAG: hypothetical protein ACI8RZ_006925 [Myxococcota bacterium]|jgi:hypothetical protein
MPLVKLSHGAAVNPESLKYITIESKNIDSQIVYGVMVRIDDNSDHWIAGYTEKDEAIAQVKAYAKILAAADE